MFWDVNFNSESIDSLLNKEDVTLKELLDDEDILQDYKYQNKNLTQFLHRTEIIDELVTLITTEPPTDVPETLRFKHPNIACEILTSEVPTLIERLVGSRGTLEKLYAFLEQDPPLNPLLTSFCSKTFGMLLSKKPDQDWFSYQCVCLQMLEFIKSRPGFLNTIYKHIGTPVIMDLLYQIITSVEGEELRNSLFDWLKEQQMISNLIKMLGNEDDSDKHNNIAQFLCEIIATGRNTRQTEVQKRGFVDVGSESSDPLMAILEDDATTALLLDLILTNKRESSIVSGILIILKLLESPIGNEAVTDSALQFLADAEKQHHKKIVANIVRQIKPRIKDLHELLLNPPPKNDIKTTITVLSPPFGNTRLYIVSLFSVLLETGNLNIMKSVCETSFFETLLNLFKQYCWNNILHNQVRKCFLYVFNAFDSADDNSGNPSDLQIHVLVKSKTAAKFIDCWKHNDETQSGHKGRRLGYMGHLIDMFDMLYTLVLDSGQFRALVESHLTESELEYWKEITDSKNGYLTAALKAQKSYLAGIDPNQTYSFDTSVTKDFQDENYTGDYYNELEPNMHNSVDDLGGEELFEATCNSRNANAFDHDMDDDITWSSSDLKSDFDSAFAKSDVFEQGGGSDKFINKQYKQDDILNTLIPRNDTDWADFDSHFNDFQISDKNDFPALEQKIYNQNAKYTSDDAANGNSNGYNGIGGQKTFAEVAAWGSPSDSNAIDIKRWGSVGNDLGDVNTTEQTLAKYSLSNYNGNDDKNQVDSKSTPDVTTNATTESTDNTATNIIATANTTTTTPTTSNDIKSTATTNGPVETETLSSDQTNNSEIGSDNKFNQTHNTMDTNAEPLNCENENPTQ